MSWFGKKEPIELTDKERERYIRKIEKLEESQTELENTLLERQRESERVIADLKMKVLAAVAEDIEPEDIFALPLEGLSGG